MTSRWALAPAGIARLTRYPSTATELPLPQAEQAGLSDAAGLRYGFRGWVTVRARPERWQEVHRAAAGRGLEGVVLDAVREAAGTFDPGRAGGIGAGGLTADLQAPLAAALASRGIDLRRVEVDALDRLEAADTPPEDPGTRLLVVGLDGADWEILEPLLAQGRMPNLAGLIERGASGKLLTISPMLSPVIWTTVATGVEPSRHGILDFLVHDTDGNQRQPVTSVQRRAAALWQILGRAGFDVGVTGWWATWPAEPVHGYLVADRLAYQLFDYRSDPEDAVGKTWPSDLYGDVRNDIVPPDGVPWERVAAYLGRGSDREERFDAEERKLLDEFRTLLAAGDTYVGIADRLRRRFHPRFECVYLEGTDTVGHLFMRFRAPRLPGVSERQFEAFRDVVDRYYEEADRYLGRLLADRGDDWTVLVLSDHGFASDATRPQSTDSRIGHGAAAAWHRRFGVFVLSGPAVRAGVRVDEASVYDVAPTVLALFGQPVPRSWPGRVLTGALTPGFLESHPVRFATEDPPRRPAEGAMVAVSGDPSADELVAKLESLGYVSAGGGENDSVTFRNNQGVALMAEGRFVEAERVFREGLQAFPRQAMLRVNLGLALRQQGRDADAAPELERAMEAPSARRIAGYHLSQIALARGDVDEAERILRRVLEHEPDASELLTALGQVLEREGDAAAAERIYRRAADVDRDAAQPRNLLGNMARAARRPDEAERWYLAAIDSDPYFMGAYNNLALVYQDTGRLQEAIELYGRALDKSPGNPVVLNNLASLHYARGELDEAARLWRRSIQVLPTYPSPYNNLAGIEISRGRWNEATPLLRRALELDPGYGDARVNLAIVHRATGDVAAAVDDLRRAADDPRSRGQALLQWGLIDLERGDLSGGLARLERARVELGDTPSVLNVLGQAYVAVGRPDEARAVWRRSLEMTPDQPAVRARLEQLER